MLCRIAIPVCRHENNFATRKRAEHKEQQTRHKAAQYGKSGSARNRFLDPHWAAASATLPGARSPRTTCQRGKPQGLHRPTHAPRALVSLYGPEADKGGNVTASPHTMTDLELKHEIDTTRERWNALLREAFGRPTFPHSWLPVGVVWSERDDHGSSGIKGDGT